MIGDCESMSSEKNGEDLGCDCDGKPVMGGEGRCLRLELEWMCVVIVKNQLDNLPLSLI